jgi:hypothetical protein
MTGQQCCPLRTSLTWTVLMLTLRYALVSKATVSTCLEWSLLMSASVGKCQPLFSVFEVRGNILTTFLALSVDGNISMTTGPQLTETVIELKTHPHTQTLLLFQSVTHHIISLQDTILSQLTVFY